MDRKTRCRKVSLEELEHAHGGQARVVRTHRVKNVRDEWEISTMGMEFGEWQRSIGQARRTCVLDMNGAEAVKGASGLLPPRELFKEFQDCLDWSNEK
jgi:hypothetical protein